MNKDLIAIFEYLEREKGIKRELVVQAIKEAVIAAAEKSLHNSGNVNVYIDEKTGDLDVFVEKTIVSQVNDPNTEISLNDAKELAAESQLGQRIELSVNPSFFGRIAAKTARQLITQRIKGAERDVIYEEFRHRLHEIVSGKIKRFARGRTMIVDLGKVEAILFDRNYPITEKYQVGDRVQALLWEVRDTDIGGAEVILTRSHPEFVAALFQQEVPELEDGLVTIEKTVREAGYRTKIAVASHDPKVDPVGTCVGVRGTRIKNIIREIHNEKIDVIPYSEDPIQLLHNALEPIEVKRLKSTDEGITLIINDEDYPTVIGKKGQNARLLSRLIEKEITIQKISDYQKLVTVQMAELGDSNDPDLDAPLHLEGMSSLIVESLKSAGYDTLRKILQAKPIDLMAAVPGLNYLDLSDKIFEQRGTSWPKT
ncbi:MAG: transcription termination/antitermination protein NusA [Parachlamydiales bacterium]|nr:transcription termination/antitermination protein NusA [Parachlamydiales bacterium]